MSRKPKDTVATSPKVDKPPAWKFDPESGAFFATSLEAVMEEALRNPWPSESECDCVDECMCGEETYE